MTLTETAYYTRLAIKYGILATVAFFVIKFLWGVGMGIYQYFVPPPPPPAEAKFGKLPALVFEQQEVPSYTFSLQTPTGELPADLPPLVDVYFMPTATASFLNLDEARKIASQLGFDQDEQSLSDVIYRFGHNQYEAVLDINIVNKTFAISYDLVKDQELLGLNVLSTRDAETAVSNFLSRAGILPDDLKGGQIKSDLLKFQGSGIASANSLSETNFIKVNFLRQDYGDLGVLSSKKDEANVWFLVSGVKSGPRQIVAGEYHYFPIDEEQKSTYKIKTAQEAWDELTEGEGLIVQPPSSGENQITTRRVYLAYYDSGRPQEYLQPIFVFDGDEGFRAYVPAVTQEFYGE